MLKNECQEHETQCTFSDSDHEQLFINPFLVEKLQESIEQTTTELNKTISFLQNEIQEATKRSVDRENEFRLKEKQFMSSMQDIKANCDLKVENLKLMSGNLIIESICMIVYCMSLDGRIASLQLERDSLTQKVDRIQMEFNSRCVENKNLVSKIEDYTETIQILEKDKLHAESQVEHLIKDLRESNESCSVLEKKADRLNQLETELENLGKNYQAQLKEREDNIQQYQDRLYYLIHL